MGWVICNINFGSHRQGLFFRMTTRTHTMKLFISKDFCQNSWCLRLIRCTMQNLWWIKEIWRISWKSKEVLDFTTGIKNKISCSFYNQGICKSGPGWMFDHTHVYCETQIRGWSCRNCSNMEWFVNTVTIKVTMLEEWNACFCIAKTILRLLIKIWEVWCMFFFLQW